MVHGVGGSFDVLAGLTRRAPVWYQDHGLEWIYRAWQEPVRLGRRYLTTNAAFVALVVRELMSRQIRGHFSPTPPPTGAASQPAPSGGLGSDAGPGRLAP